MPRRDDWILAILCQGNVGAHTHKGLKFKPFCQHLDYAEGE